ncbi:MAG: GTPase Era [Desulfitibacter sp. BRH_c19]|nr:MAG: GTPase Era [Desulfitibacter sp. BRH_c19]
MQDKKFKSGFVAIVGRPNVGKSTLMNNLIGKKIAIMSDKPQTTRNKITGVFTRPELQIVFIDTPGIHKPKTKLGEVMVGLTARSLKEVDLILYLVDSTAKIGKGDALINETLSNSKLPIIIALNKIDSLEKQQILEKHLEWQATGVSDTIIPISALENINLEKVIEVIGGHLEEGPQYYPDDMITDQPENMVVAEIIREKVLHLTRDEIPHSTAVVLDAMEERQNNMMYLDAIIYIERDSQKGIIIGKGGSMLKNIGQTAREEIEGLLNTRVYLDIRVKVKKNWRKEASHLKNMGYDTRFLKD